MEINLRTGKIAEKGRPLTNKANLRLSPQKGRSMSEKPDGESRQVERIVMPPFGYRILETHEKIQDGDIIMASWSKTGWVRGVGENELGKKAGEVNTYVARKKAV